MYARLIYTQSKLFKQCIWKSITLASGYQLMPEYTYLDILIQVWHSWAISTEELVLMNEIINTFNYNQLILRTLSIKSITFGKSFYKKLSVIWGRRTLSQRKGKCMAASYFFEPSPSVNHHHQLVTHVGSTYFP